MNNKLKSELKVGDIYTFRVKRKQVKQIEKEEQVKNHHIHLLEGR